MPAGTITALQIQEKDKERINVFIDHEFALGISLRTLEQSGLYKGKVIDDADWEQLVKAEQMDKAYNAALNFLSARPRSTREIRDRLRQKDYPDDHIDVALAKLEKLGLVNDEAFARFWVENRQNCRPKGARALQSELQQKGVEREVISQVLDTMTNTDDERDNALVIARGALRRYQNEPDKWAFSRKMGAFLQRRGFGFEAIKPAVDTLWGEIHGLPGADDDADDE
jgi:regulatory protein